MKKVIGVILLALSIGCLTAAAQLPSCQDGSLRFDFAAVPSGVFLPGFGFVGEPIVTFYLYGGKFVPCWTKGNTQGHFYRYRTGPRTERGAGRLQARGYVRTGRMVSSLMQLTILAGATF
jgi:hypothetical protein